MAQRTARLQVPIDKEVLQELEHIADQLGFDSVPAMVRFWAKAEVNRNKRRDDSEAYTHLKANAVALHYVELILIQGPANTSPERALSYLNRKLTQARLNKSAKGLPLWPTSDKIWGT